MVGDILQPTHLLLILVVALLVLGPKRLPEVGRQLGNGLRDFRAAINGERVEPQESQAKPTGVQLGPAPDYTDQAVSAETPPAPTYATGEPAPTYATGEPAPTYAPGEPAPAAYAEPVAPVPPPQDHVYAVDYVEPAPATAPAPASAGADMPLEQASAHSTPGPVAPPHAPLG